MIKFIVCACMVFAACIALSLPLSAKQFVVVIDPGHGGKDYGALGKKINEKTINLNVALKLGEMIESKCSDVKVVYTRDNDRFISLQQRANIANKANGNLFISIHTNSVDKKVHNRTSYNGASTYTLGMHKNEENLAVAKRENSVMKLEEDFSTTYQGFDPNSTESYIIFEISQSKHVEQSVDFAQRVQREFVKTADRKDNGVRQAGFWVLAKTSMPAVLVELDFICNPKMEEFLGSKSGQESLAKAIFNAFKSYKNSYFVNDGTKQKDRKKKSNGKEKPESDELYASGNDDAVDDSKPETADNAQVASDDEIEYRVQIFTSPKRLKDDDSRIKNLKDVNYYYEKGLYKYTCGSVKDKKDALSLQKEVRKQFPQAFVVTFKGGKRIY
ncbi:MAG: N-acetylmuramoyl-L-alanine amidase [Muribaculaceae bacterium]